MAATNYKIFNWGAATNDGVDEQYIAAIQVRAKRSTVCHYTVANEYVCQEVGRAIGLPIPVGVTIDKDGVVFYASMDFNLSGQGLPPADSQAVINDLPELSLGIVMFDIWIGNRDRHEGNISYNRDTKTLHLYDHGQSLLWPDGIESVDKVNGSLGIAEHCLADKLKLFDSRVMWYNRINALPDYFIRDTVRDAVSMGLPRDNETDVANHLIERRSELLGLIACNRSAFHAADATLFDNWGGEYLDYCI